MVPLVIALRRLFAATQILNCAMKLKIVTQTEANDVVVEII